MTEAGAPGDAMRATGGAFPNSDEGRLRPAVLFDDEVADGPMTVEAHRHGYRPASAAIDLVARMVTRVRIVLIEDPTPDWRP